jgi:hypothetical protein
MTGRKAMREQSPIPLQAWQADDAQLMQAKKNQDQATDANQPAAVLRDN